MRGIWKFPLWLKTDGLFCLFLRLIRKIYSSCLTVFGACFTFLNLSSVFLFWFFGMYDDGLFWQFAIVYNLSINYCLSERLYISNGYSGSFYYINFKFKQILKNWQTSGLVLAQLLLLFFWTVLTAYNISSSEKLFLRGNRAEVTHVSKCENLPSYPINIFWGVITQIIKNKQRFIK